MKDNLFSCPVQIRMSDLDPFDHVNNGAQCNLFDYGRSLYFEHLFGTKIDWMTFDYVLVHVDMDFALPIRIHDTMECETEITELGRSSVRMTQRLCNGTNGAVHTTCHAVLVRFDRQQLCSLEIPETHRALFHS